MASETLGSGFQNGYNWLVDHDDVAGTIGVTVTDNGNPQTGQLMLHGEVIRRSNGNVIATVGPIRIDQDDNLGRRVLYTNAQLVGVSMLSSGTFAFNIWTTFQPG